MVAAMMWIDAAFYVPSFVGPISKATGGADFSWAVGIAVGGLAYLVMSVGSIGREMVAGTQPAS